MDSPMYRFVFSKVQFLKPTTATQVLIEIETQNNDRFRTKPKKVKNNVAKFYGDFIEFEKEYWHFCIRILELNDKKMLILCQKINLRHEIIEHKNKKSHVISTPRIRIQFQSEIVLNVNSSNETTVSDFSEMRGKYYISPRLNIMKRSKQMSSDSIKNRKMTLSIGYEKRIISKSFMICQKQTIDNRNLW